MNLPSARHRHDFAPDTSVAERRTRWVIAITAAMMVVEIAAGTVFQSMALLADGWHMSTHVAAFLLTAIAYSLSRRHADDPAFSFGTGKMGVLGGFASAVILGVVALLMVSESVHRLLEPVTIQFDQAIAVAIVGLGVNIVCAVLLKEHPHHHGAGHEHHHHHHPGEDLNRRAAYLHVLADALTSVTAVFALVAGRFFGWGWMDPAMGIAGSLVVAVWAWGLLRETGGILLDRTPETCDLPDEIRRAVESGGTATIADLHVWQLSPGRFAAIVGIDDSDPKPASFYEERLLIHEELVHLTVDVRHRTPNENASALAEAPEAG